MGAKKTGRRCPHHSGQLVLPSHEALGTFQKDATGPWRRVVFKAESALLQHNCDQPFFQTGFPVACHESGRRPKRPRIPGPLGGSPPYCACSPRAQRLATPSDTRDGGCAAILVLPRGSDSALCGSPWTPFWRRAWLPVTLTQRPPWSCLLGTVPAPPRSGRR